MKEYIKFLDKHGIHAGLSRVFIVNECWPAAIESLSEHQEKLRIQIDFIQELKEMINEKEILNK